MQESAGNLERGLDRREFTLKFALAILSGVTITIIGCGDDSSPMSSTPTPTPTPDQPTSGEVMGSISANHGHEAVITGAQLMEGNALQLDITGNADHPHTVELSADELDQIGNGQTVSKTSTTELAHNHIVAFN